MKISVKAAIDAYGMTKGIVRYTAYCLILIASLWLSSCNKSNPTQTEEIIITTELKLTEDQEKSYGITFGSPQVRMVYDAVALGGVVEAPPQQTASVSFPLAGNVRSIHVLAGNQVQKGSTLALIESIELIQLQEDYWKTLGQLTFAEQERERQKKQQPKICEKCRFTVTFLHFLSYNFYRFTDIQQTLKCVL